MANGILKKNYLILERKAFEKKITRKGKRRRGNGAGHKGVRTTRKEARRTWITMFFRMLVKQKEKRKKREKKRIYLGG